MMNSIVFVGISAICCIVFILVFKRRSVSGRPRTSVKSLHQVEAGSTHRLFNRKIDLSKAVEVDMANIKTRPDVEYFVVKNQCMNVRGISDGDIVGVKMFDGDFTLSGDSKAGNLLLIYLDTPHFKGYKIREQGERVSGKEAYDTYHYKNGVKTRSSLPHSVESIRGVVVDVFRREYQE